MDRESLYDLVRNEGGFALSNEVLKKFLSKGSQKILNKEEYLIKPGEVDKSLWITESGITKAVINEGNKEYVVGFSGPGTITMSPISQILGKPAFCGFQTITYCRMIKIENEDFVNLMEESHEFALWMYGVLMHQLCALELKSRNLSEGDAMTNFKHIVKRQMQLDQDGFDPKRPDLLPLISSKDLASYLGITQSYLSNIRKAIIEEERKKMK